MHHNYHHHLFRKHISENAWQQTALRRLYAASLLHDLGLQMLSLFILFYLYEKGWPLMLVVTYLLFFTMLGLLAKRSAAFLIGKVGIIKTMLLGNVLRVVFTASLFSLAEPSPIGYGLLALIVTLDALSFSIYYTAWDFYFAGLEQNEKAGRQAAFAWALAAFAAILAPLAGGLLAQFWGFKTAMVVASVLLLFSILPLIVSERHKSILDAQRLRKILTFKHYWQIFKATHKGSLVAFAASNMVFNIFLPLWMLYLAIYIFADKAYGGLGILLAASSVIALLVSLLAGRLIDRGYCKPLLMTNSLIECLLGGLRFFVIGIPLAMAHNFIHQQAWAHSIVTFQWYYGQESDPINRLAFFQMCSYFQTLMHVIVVLAIIICLLIFTSSQMEVLKYACIALGLSGALMFGLSLKGHEASS